MMDKKLIDRIAKIVGDENINLNLDRLYAYPPDTEAIREVLALAREERLNIIPVGTESKVNYQRTLKENTLILNLSRFNRIKKVVPEDLYVILEPGILLKEINKNLKSYGVFYPLAKSQDKGTVGGSIGAGIKGTTNERAVLTRDFTLALEVVLASGEKLKTGARVFKSVTGYDLPKLFVGSWGSLGIITEVSLRLHPLERKDDFENISFTAPVMKKVDRVEDDPKIKLNRKIKEALDPSGIFTDFVS